jgi:hypothetical protein
MRRIWTVIAFAAATSLIAAGLASAAGGTKAPSSTVWVIPTGKAALTSSPMPTLAYGTSFSAGFSSSKASYPWAHVECFAVDPATGAVAGTSFWGEWRALQADGTIGVFDLTTAGGTTWPSGGASCVLSLVNTTPKTTVLATTGFLVTQ